MRASNLVIFILVAAVAVPTFGQDPPVQTTRDAQGVWFIEGGSLYEVFEAMGYAVATDRLFQMDLNRRTARGKLSEVLGPDRLETDVFLRTIAYSEEELTAEFNALSEDAQTAVQGYVDGINRRIAEIQSNWMVMPYEFWIGSFYYIYIESLGFNYLPTPWTVNDALAWTAMFFRGFDPEGIRKTGQLDNIRLFQTWAAVYPDEYQAMFFDLRWLNDPSAQTMIPAPPGAKSDPLPGGVPNVTADDFPDLRAVAEQVGNRVDAVRQKLNEIGALPKMGSYAWAVSGDKTATGNPILYSGPQMGFEVPSNITEGSIRGGGLEVSGMHVPGMPAIAIGRTPHHAWSGQVGHAHTTDYFIEPPQAVVFNRFETINIAGADPVTIPVFRSSHGPIVNPLPFDPTNPPEPPDQIVSWAYANWGHEADAVDALLDAARATSIEEFDAGIAKIGVSQHACYVDRDGNIAYWMTGFDPIRAPGVLPLFPQIGNGTQEWTGDYRPLAHDVNTAQGYYGGWNNKASVDYINSPNNLDYGFGFAHRAHVIEEYLSTHDDLTFDDLRDLALDIATTDALGEGDPEGFGAGGKAWTFVGDFFTAAVAADPSDDRDAAIAMIEAWDGHFVAGGPTEWRMGTTRADAWVLLTSWVREVLRLTFEDEFAGSGMDWSTEHQSTLFNVLLRALAGSDAVMPTNYDWFQDKLGSGKPTTAEGIIVQALDTVIADMGLGPYNEPRGEIVFGHAVLAGLLDPLLGTSFGNMHSMPYSARSTYAHVVEYGENGPIRIESMFPLGTSGQLWFNGTFAPTIDPNMFSMAPYFDPFMPRDFPTFE